MTSHLKFRPVIPSMVHGKTPKRWQSYILVNKTGEKKKKKHIYSNLIYNVMYPDFLRTIDSVIQSLGACFKHSWLINLTIVISLVLERDQNHRLRRSCFIIRRCRRTRPIISLAFIQFIDTVVSHFQNQKALNNINHPSIGESRQSAKLHWTQTKVSKFSRSSPSIHFCLKSVLRGMFSTSFRYYS